MPIFEAFKNPKIPKSACEQNFSGTLENEDLDERIRENA